MSLPIDPALPPALPHVRYGISRVGALINPSPGAVTPVPAEVAGGEGRGGMSRRGSLATARCPDTPVAVLRPCLFLSSDRAWATVSDLLGQDTQRLDTMHALGRTLADTRRDSAGLCVSEWLTAAGTSRHSASGLKDSTQPDVRSF